MIELKHVKKIFEQSVLFQDLNLTIHDKEYVVLSGKSGCGKTTILNIIGGLEKIEEGQVLVDGKDISKTRNKLKYFQNKVGFLFQNFALIENKTVYDNLDLVYDKSRNGVSIEDALEKVGLKDKMKTKVYKLSGGEQQRIAVARLMIKKCDIVLADEPTGSLDDENGKMVMDLIDMLPKMGKTIVLVTHNEEYKTLGERVINLSELTNLTKVNGEMHEK